MDGSVQNSALYPRGMEPFPGAKTLHPRELRCQNLTCGGRGLTKYGAPSIPVRHNSTDPAARRDVSESCG
ncbi:hypothetical protein NDU88_007663 [Pleurodeles waltl]|uniref:Uncharacterized protein n=1 Tax=Pleurodeles waltl TaxID=8319 RepID=A0AAV7QMQ8_PLEWA|nr:hypothetical protein NDU88_007663 [Pleurodeles waltl]